MLVKSIEHVEQRFEGYAQMMLELSECGGSVGEDVMSFYKKKESRQGAARAFRGVQDHIAGETRTFFDERFNGFEGVTPGFSDWKAEVNELRERVTQLENLRVTAHNRKEKIKGLSAQPGKMTGMFTGGDKGDRDQEIKEEQEMYKEEVKQYKKMRTEIKNETSAFLVNRFSKFDAIFVRFMELQSKFFVKSAELCKGYNEHVSLYRQSHPSQGVFDENDSESSSESEEESAQATSKTVRPPRHPEKADAGFSDFVSSPPQGRPAPIPAAPAADLSNAGKLTPKFMEADLLDLGFGAPSKAKVQSAPIGAPPKAKVQPVPAPPSTSVGGGPQPEPEDTFGLFAAAPQPQASPGSQQSSDFDFFNSNINQPSQQQSPQNFFPSFDEDPFGMFQSSPPSQKPPPEKREPRQKGKERPKQDSTSMFDPMSAGFSPVQKKQPPMSNPRRAAEDGRVFHEELPDDPELRKKILAAQKKKIDELHALQNKERIANDIRARANDSVEAQADDWEFSSPNVRKNLRTLISSMQDILDYEECQWKPMQLHQLLQPRQVKKAYRKAMKHVHPDRVGSLEPLKRAKAERVFTALTESYKQFEEENKHRM